MQAFGILLLFIGVAGSAVYPLESFGVGKFLSSQIAVTTGAVLCGVR
jgi:hypothetical protein